MSELRRCSRLMVLGERLSTVGISRRLWLSWSRLATGTVRAIIQAAVETSLGSTGDSHENALADTINGLYKTELVRKKGPRKTVDALEREALNWVDWLNQTRLLELMCYFPPAEFEAPYECGQQET